MSIEMIERDFREKVSAKIYLMPEGVHRFRAFTPFLFDDGDHLAIVLKQEEGRWLLSDEGHTYMHLTYDLDEKDLQRGTRQKIITNALSTFHVEDRDGELILEVVKPNRHITQAMRHLRNRTPQDAWQLHGATPLGDAVETLWGEHVLSAGTPVCSSGIADFRTKGSFPMPIESVPSETWKTSIRWPT